MYVHCGLLMGVWASRNYYDERALLAYVTSSASLPPLPPPLLLLLLTLLVAFNLPLRHR